MDVRLRNAASPRLILVGGSNLSLGINSQMLKDSLALNPINTGISVGIGLCYMLDNTLKHVRKNDVVVVSPEYDHFFDRVSLGDEHLVRTVFDVAPESLPSLKLPQALKIAPLIPHYSFSKLKVREYISERDPSEIYDRNAFNIYGDNCKHWNLPTQNVDELNPLNVISFDYFVIDQLGEFETKLNQRGAKLFITFPGLQQASFFKQRAGIKKVQKELKRAGFSLLGTPERYIMPDSLLFDTPYHLIKKGVDLRTSLLVEDLKSSLHNPALNPNLVFGKVEP